MYFCNAKKLEPEILSWPLHSYMNHPKRKEKCRQLLFPSRYHNEHVSLETETPKICTACISLFVTNEKNKCISNTCSKQFCFGEIQSSSPLQGKLPYSFLPPAETKVRLQEYYKLTAVHQHLQVSFLGYQTSFPVSEGDFWLLK